MKKKPWRHDPSRTCQRICRLYPCQIKIIHNERFILILSRERRAKSNAKQTKRERERERERGRKSRWVAYATVCQVLQIIRGGCIDNICIIDNSVQSVAGDTVDKRSRTEGKVFNIERRKLHNLTVH